MTGIRAGHDRVIDGTRQGPGWDRIGAFMQPDRSMDGT